MSLIQTGRTFNDGEQLTAAKLNQMFSDATLSTTGVDGTSIIINENDTLAVRSINNARIDTGAVTFNKIQEIPTNTVLGRTTTETGIVEEITVNTDNAMASASATTLATDGSIKAYINSLDLGGRPKFIPLTGGTTDLTKEDENDGATVIYNIADFTADLATYPEFDTSKITGIVIHAETRAGTVNANNHISVSLPDGTDTLICRSFSGALTGQFFTPSRNGNSFTVPINAGQTSFTLSYTVGSAIVNRNKTIIKGAIIN